MIKRNDSYYSSLPDLLTAPTDGISPFVGCRRELSCCSSETFRNTHAVTVILSGSPEVSYGCFVLSSECSVASSVTCGTYCGTSARCYGTSVMHYRVFVACNRDVVTCHRSAVACNRNAVTCHRNAVACNRNAVTCHRSAVACNRNAVTCHKDVAVSHSVSVTCHSVMIMHCSVSVAHSVTFPVCSGSFAACPDPATVDSCLDLMDCGINVIHGIKTGAYCKTAVHSFKTILYGKQGLYSPR
jgi:hypothetical protein